MDIHNAQQLMYETHAERSGSRTVHAPERGSIGDETVDGVRAEADFDAAAVLILVKMSPGVA
jgi:hypothetical protein